MAVSKKRIKVLRDSHLFLYLQLRLRDVRPAGDADAGRSLRRGDMLLRGRHVCDRRRGCEADSTALRAGRDKGSAGFRSQGLKPRGNPRAPCRRRWAAKQSFALPGGSKGGPEPLFGAPENVPDPCAAPELNYGAVGRGQVCVVPATTVAGWP